ncbi:MAG: hypothetical protein GWP14_10710, partial [Actinobacteria bacterium]|nr:hypothetical protein [Actinomycetota bacterium]
MLSISDDKGFVFDVDADYAVISKDGREVARFCLAPVSGNNKTTLGPWREVDKYHLAADVHGLEATAHLRIDHGYACYHLESSIGHFERLYYLTAGCIDGDGWQSYLSDVNDCFRSYDLDNQVPISSCFDGLSPDEEDGAGMCDPGDNPPTWIWNVPVRVAALNSWAGWIGLSLPGPLPVGVTRMSVKDRKFDLLFEQCQPSCRQGAMPRVYFLTGLEGNYDALPAHRDLSFALGWMVKHSAKSPEWWSSPTYKISIDLCSKQVDDRGVHKVDAFSVDEKGRKRSFLTTEFVREHVRAWRQQCRLDTDPVRMHLDQNYFYGYGSRRVLKELGGVDGLRQFTDQLRSQGVYIGPYYNP